MNKLTLEQLPENAFLNRGGQQEGPYSVDQINQLLATGQVQWSDWVWAEGWSDWKQLSSLVPTVPPPLIPPPFPQQEKPAIYLSKGGQQLEPFTLTEINSQLQGRTLVESDQAWIEGWPEWAPLSSVPGIIRSVNPPLPLIAPSGSVQATPPGIIPATLGIGAVDIASLDVSPKWKECFLAMKQLGWNENIASFLQNFDKTKQLTFAEKWKIGKLFRNFWGMLFGPFYYFAKGMWKKGLFILGVAIGLGLLCGLLNVSWLDTATDFMVPIFCLGMANYDYYLFKVYRKSWYFASTKVNSGIIGALCLLLLVLGFASLGASSDSPSDPIDPRNQVVYKKTFTIMQILSPGRALAQEVRSVNITDSDMSDQVYLLVGIPGNVVDDENWTGWVFPGDIFTYTTAQNAPKTVKSFIVSTNQNPKNVKVERRVQIEGDYNPTVRETTIAYPDTNVDAKPTPPTQ